MPIASPTVSGGQVKFSFDKKQLDWITNRLKKLSPQERDGAIERGFRKLTLATEKTLKEDILRGQVLNVRSGRLRTSIGSLVRRSGRNIEGVVGSGVRSGRRVPYANIHETGGVIRPKASNKSGFLWIPIRKGSGFAIVRGLSGEGDRTSFSSRTVGFIKVRSVTIPERRYMTKAVQKVDRVAVAIMLKEIDAEIDKK